MWKVVDRCLTLAFTLALAVATFFLAYPGSCTKGPIQVETQEPPYGKNAVSTGILATTEAPA